MHPLLTVAASSLPYALEVARLTGASVAVLVCAASQVFLGFFFVMLWTVGNPRRGLSFVPGVFSLTGRPSGLFAPPGRDPKGRPFWNLLNLPNLSRGGFLNFAISYAL